MTSSFDSHFKRWRAELWLPQPAEQPCASTVNYDRLFCPSLQDTCKLYLLATIDEYPVDILAKLPLHMRRKLFMAMPVIDRVHFEGTAFLNGLQVVEYKDFISSTSNAVFLSSTDSAAIKADLVSALFSHLEEEALAKLCSLNLQDAFGLFDCLNSSSMKDNTEDDTDLIVRLVYQVIYSLHYSRLYAFHTSRPVYHYNASFPFGYSNDDDVRNAIIVPCRPFIHPPQPDYGDGSSPSQRVFYYKALQLQNYECFAKYCQLASCVPTHLEINSVDFLQSLIWRDYKITRDEATKQAKAKGISDISAVDPFVCKPTYPYLQELLCTVEHLTLGTNAKNEFANYNTYDSYFAVPYILMSAITANNTSANLKSISVYGIAKRAVRALFAIAGFLIGSDYFASSSSYHVECDGFHYNLSPPDGDPFLIESLSFNAFDGFRVREMTTVSNSRSVCKVLKAVVSKQMGSMKNISVFGIGIVSDAIYGPSKERFHSYRDRNNGEAPSDVTAEEYESLLMSSFVEFVKQPQFNSLTLSESPESCCYQLVTAFLTTPTSHDQTLSLSVKKADSAYNIDLSSLPSGAAFKSLNFTEESDDCKLCRQVASIPELCLKSIQVPALALTSVSDGVRIDIPHVRINFCKLPKTMSQYYKKLCHGISLFLCRNISLATLEFNIPGSSSVIVHACFLPIVNAALNTLLSNQDSSQKTLEEIQLKYANYQHFTDDPNVNLNNIDNLESKSSDDDLSRASDSRVVCPDFHSSGSTHVDFFLLVHKLDNVSLRLPAPMLVRYSVREELVPTLEKHLKGKKLPKITVEGVKKYWNSCDSTLLKLEQIFELVQYT